MVDIAELCNAGLAPTAVGNNAVGHGALLPNAN